METRIKHKNHAISIRVDSDLKNKIECAATDSKRSVGNYIRLVLQKAIDVKLKV